MGMDSELPLPSARGRRCARHSLAAGPDGQCALCRSESLPPPRPYSTWLLGGIFVAILVVTVGALAQRGWQLRASPAAVAEAPAAFPSVTATAEAAAAEPSPGEPPPGQSVPVEPPLPPPAVVTVTPASPPTAATASATPQRAAATRPPPSEAELRAAMNATPIVMYATTWCGVCRKARAFMAENGLRYQEIDADTTPGGWEKVEQLGGRKAVPVIVVDGDVSLGLSPERIMNGVARSIERRLGITGVTFRSNGPGPG